MRKSSPGFALDGLPGEETNISYFLRAVHMGGSFCALVRGFGMGLDQLIGTRVDVAGRHGTVAAVTAGYIGIAFDARAGVPARFEVLPIDRAGLPGYEDLSQSVVAGAIRAMSMNRFSRKVVRVVQVGDTFFGVDDRGRVVVTAGVEGGLEIC